MPSYRFKFSSEVYSSRKRMKLTQEQAAEMFDISTRWYQVIEKGERLPGAELMLTMIAVFEIDGKNIKGDD